MAMFDDNDITYPEDEGLPEESSNRTFIIAASVLGGIILLALICVAAYALVVIPNQRSGADDVEVTRIAQNTQVAQMLTETAVANAFLTPIASPSAIFSPTASPTPVVAVATETPSPTPDIAATGTVAAALTQAAIAIQTTVPTAAALPDGGFADDVGLPGLAGLMIALIAVIFFARWFRKAPAN
ncbi:MAG: hypothetical protein ISR59_05235 [Anaerolineales bacterium]|nr:hypothetical protein [Anaerolineales bacterium]